jgi:hypothetical protein
MLEGVFLIYVVGVMCFFVWDGEKEIRQTVIFGHKYETCSTDINNIRQTLGNVLWQICECFGHKG